MEQNLLLDSFGQTKSEPEQWDTRCYSWWWKIHLKWLIIVNVVLGLWNPHQRLGK